MVPKVSIIVPCFNVSRFVKTSLSSVREQNLRDWECICVDDGSTDDTFKVLLDCAELDNRFQVVHQVNRGVALARQAGLDLANGEWIAWIDADDFADPDWLLNLVKTAEAANADMVWSDFIQHERDVSSRIKQEFLPDCDRHVEALLDNTCWGALWNKLLRRRFVIDKGVRFPSYRVRAREDLLFLCRLLAKKPRLAYSPYADYHYVIRKGSAVHSRNQIWDDSGIRILSDLEAVPHSAIAEKHINTMKELTRYQACMMLSVSNSAFNQILPEIRAIHFNRDIPIAKRILFWLSVRGLRPLVVWGVRMMRSLRHGERDGEA